MIYSESTPAGIEVLCPIIIKKKCKGEEYILDSLLSKFL